jgi:hypothetical protein
VHLSWPHVRRTYYSAAGVYTNTPARNATVPDETGRGIAAFVLACLAEGLAERARLHHDRPVALLFHALLFLLAATPDAGLLRDAGIPPWAPQLRPIDTLEGSYGLRRWGDGYVYEDDKFEARVAPDGTASFKDKRGGASLFTPFSWIGKSRAQQRQQSPDRAARDPVAYRRTPWIAPSGPSEDPRRIPQSELCPPGSSCSAVPVSTAVQVSGSFDLTDELLRALGKDPHARDKARFLSATFEFRIKLAIEGRKRLMKKALDDLPRHLEALWADERYSPRERRRILFELWYEMDRTPEGDRAAKTIDAFIRRRLPCGGADGYTPGELDAFRRSHPDRPFSAGDACTRPPAERDPR